jgi:hypothetical protein
VEHTIATGAQSVNRDATERIRIQGFDERLDLRFVAALVIALTAFSKNLILLQHR